MNVLWPYVYNREFEYIQLPLPSAVFAEFPERVTWHGETLVKKQEFHMTILSVNRFYDAVNTRSLEDKSSRRTELLALFSDFVSHNPIGIFFTSDFRYAVKEGQRSIVARCFSPDLSEFFAALNAQFHTHIPVQPAHVTLYARPFNLGIPINSDEAMNALGKVELAELDRAMQSIQL